MNIPMDSQNNSHKSCNTRNKNNNNDTMIVIRSTTKPLMPRILDRAKDLDSDEEQQNT